jgi:hypothetical protein
MLSATLIVTAGGTTIHGDTSCPEPILQTALDGLRPRTM